jgi:hypothetical protein
MNALQASRESAAILCLAHSSGGFFHHVNTNKFFNSPKATAKSAGEKFSLHANIVKYL